MYSSSLIFLMLFLDDDEWGIKTGLSMGQNGVGKKRRWDKKTFFEILFYGMTPFCKLY